MNLPLAAVHPAVLIAPLVLATLLLLGIGVASGALRVLRAELARMLTSWVAIVAAFLCLLVPVLRVGVSAVVQRASQLADGGQGANGLEGGAGWGMLIKGWESGLLLATVFLLVQAIRSISGDRESGVLRLAVTRSASRVGAVIGRAMVGPLLVLGMVLLSGLGSWFATRFIGRGDFGNLIIEDYAIFGDDGADYILGELKRTMQNVVLALCAMHAFGLLVSSLIRGPLIAFVVAMVPLMIWALLRDVFGPGQWFVFASHAPPFFSGSAMSELGKLAEGFSDGLIEEQVYRTGLIFTAAEGLLAVGLSCVAVRLRSI